MSSETWIAVRGRPAAEVLKELSLEGTGATSDFDYNDIISGTTLSGWLVVVDNDGATAILDEGFAQKLSLGGEAVLYYGSTTTMDSFASHHRDGALVWSYSHNLDCKGTQIIEGTPGPKLVRLRQRLEWRQSGNEPRVDYLWSTSEAWARHVIKFRPDALFFGPLRGVAFEIMRYVGPPRPNPMELARQNARRNKPWWRFW